MKAVGSANLHGEGLVRGDLRIAAASGEQADGCTDDREKPNYVPGDLWSKAKLHLSPFQIFGVFPDRNQHGCSGIRNFAQIWLPQHVGLSWRPILTPAHSTSPALSFMCGGEPWPRIFICTLVPKMKSARTAESKRVGEAQRTRALRVTAAIESHAALASLWSDRCNCVTTLHSLAKRMPKRTGALNSGRSIEWKDRCRKQECRGVA